MKIIFRADASIKIGTGHVMRCLTLAEALKDNGADVSFICRNHPGNLISYIESKNFIVHRLDVSESKTSPATNDEITESEQLLHSDWMGVTQKRDAVECKKILKQVQPDWIIVDHYSIDKTWQSELKDTYQKLMVIDDLADRQHQCDLFLDQTFGRQPQDYEGLVPANCKMLLGSQYALLRPEFSQWRDYSLSRRSQPELKKILITMGGVDLDNVTGQVLDALGACDLPGSIEITVIMGEAAPHIDAIRELAEGMLYKNQVKVGVNNMAEIMADSDLAIGATGATTWERCCLGLPAIQLVIAKNQIYSAKKLMESNVGWLINSVADLQGCIQHIMLDVESELLRASLASKSVTDGKGAEYVIEALLKEDIYE